jgi:hypothetical protein
VVVGYAPDAPLEVLDARVPTEAGASPEAGTSLEAGATEAGLLEADAAPAPPAVEAGVPDADAAPLPLPEVTWPTGAHAGNELQALSDFEDWRGRPLELVMFFVDRTVGWPGLVTPGWPVDMAAAIEGRLVLAEPLYPEGQGNNQDCAAGAYDAEWRTLGPFLSARGRGDTILRLGWGPNDGTHFWRSDDDPTDYIACYRRVVDAIRAGGASLQIAWDINPQGGAEVTALDPYLAYPGDAYVDYIGLELLDRDPPTRDAVEWQQKCRSATGLCSVIEFARARSKPIGLSEWGLSACDDGVVSGGGDNPFFIEQVVRTFADNADVMGFELYYSNGLDSCSILASGGPNPLAAETYRALYTPR